MLSAAASARPLALLVKVFPKLSETFILEEVLGLERLGVPLRLYTLAPPSDHIAHPAVAEVKAPMTAVPQRLADDRAGFLWRHARLALQSPVRYLATWRAAARRGATGRQDFLRAGWLAAQLQADGVAHLHAHFIAQPADIAQLVSSLCALPFSISAHAKDIYLSEPADLQRRLMAARFTVTCTEANRVALSTVAPQADVRRMYHGIDAAIFHPGRRGPGALVPRLLSVGRLREKKGLDTLVLACAELQRRGLPFTCDIVGYGEQQAALQDLIRQQGLDGQVRLLGKLARDQVLERYAAATVYVQPSRIAADGDRDGIPNVLLEALACGLPVVATEVSGIPELVRHGHNGLLVPPDAPQALADAIAALIDSPARAADLGRAGRATVTEHFDNDRNLQTLLRLLENAHAPAHTCAAH